MGSNKDTVVMLKEQGFTFIKGDQITNGSSYCVVGEDIGVYTANCTPRYDHFYVKSLVTPRGNPGDPLIKDSDEWVKGLPPIGYEFHVDEESKYNSHTWLFEEKIGWEHADLIRVVYADDNLDFVVCLNTQHDMLTVANIKADFFLTPDQLVEKERGDRISSVSDLIGYSDGYSYELIGKLYDLELLK